MPTDEVDPRVIKKGRGNDYQIEVRRFREGFAISIWGQAEAKPTTADQCHVVLGDSEAVSDMGEEEGVLIGVLAKCERNSSEEVVANDLKKVSSL